MSRTDKTEQHQSGKTSRRQILCLAGAGLGMALGGPVPEGTACPKRKKVLKGGDKIDLAGKAEAIIENAYKLGHEYEKKHGGCARCTVAALQDAIPFVAADRGLFRGSTCLDGGATPTGTQNCGGFTGAGMVIGYVCGSTRDETFEGSAALAHQLLHKVYYRFKEAYGTVLCQDVRKGAEGDCPEVVGRAAQWVAEVLLEEFADYVPPEPPEPAEPSKEDGPAQGEKTDPA